VTSLARLLLALAPVPFVAGALTAGAATPGYGAGDFLSELGVPGAPGAGAWHLGLAATAGCLAGAAALGGRRLPGGLLVAAALGLVAVALGVARAVPCSPRCPIPPLDPAATIADAVHVGASSLGLAAIAGAAAGLAATTRAGPRWAAFSAACAVAVAVASAAFLVAVALDARPALGLVERGLFGVIATWLVGLALHPPR
jgi:hypothetical protein